MKMGIKDFPISFIPKKEKTHVYPCGIERHPPVHKMENDRSTFIFHLHDNNPVL